MKKYIIFILCLFMITGCSSNQEEEDKSDYLALKSELVSRDEFTDSSLIDCDIDISIERIDEEIVSYTTNISNPKVNMNSIKVLVIHNYFTEDVFPSVGLFEDTKELLVDDDKSITLIGYIDTEKDIKELDLELKVWIQYTDDNGEVKDIYYKTTK